MNSDLLSQHRPITKSTNCEDCWSALIKCLGSGLAMGNPRCPFSVVIGFWAAMRTPHGPLGMKSVREYEYYHRPVEILLLVMVLSKYCAIMPYSMLYKLSLAYWLRYQVVYANIVQSNFTCHENNQIETDGEEKIHFIATTHTRLAAVYTMK